ncbi:MAG: insulinase family protein [Lachnospiraceae bacterium]|nr:insulinase family protein [Lachnospiraceae bacterium]
MERIHDAYELLRKENLKDIHSEGYVLRHKKSGAKLALIENDDENKVFYIGFRTPVSDSTGVPHIIEHSVLCGSDKYPLKDPFVELVKGSLNTFLNAMTYPDKTVYPIASTNDKDFRNLMDVYMDAVLHPNIYKKQEIFKQEGWHYEMTDPDGELTINGVVYNEMKGAFSSPDDVLEREILNSLFPDTNYNFESGGDPKDIPTLTYEGFMDFHRRYYHPCNSYIYLYGDMDMNEQLDYLDREYLSKYEKIELDSEIHHQKPFDKVRMLEKTYPVAADDDTKDQTYLAENFVIADILDPVLYQAFDILDYALLNAPGAPVQKALLDAGVGKDILGGYDNGTLQPTFSVIAKGANPEDKDRFMSIINDVLKDQVKNGLDHDAIYAAINSAQFRYREADFGSYPKGLMYGLQILDSWLYEDDQPFMHLYGIDVLDDLRNKVDTGYFEDLVQKYLIDNRHVSMLTVSPEPGKATREEEKLKQELAKKKAGLSLEEREKLVQETAALKEYQKAPDSKEDIEKIPLLKRTDLKKEARKLDYEEYTEDGIKVIYSDIETTGIHYLNLVFGINSVKEEELPYLSLYTNMLGLIDTEKYNYTQLSNEINIHTGGMSVNLKVYPKGVDGYVLTVEVRSKFLFENMEKDKELLEQIILRSDLSDKKRLKEIVMQAKSHLEMKMMSAGNQAAALRSMSHFSPCARISDETTGVGYYRFLKDLEENFDSRIDDVVAKCKELSGKVFNVNNLTVSTTGRGEALRQVREYIPELKEKLYKDNLPKTPLTFVFNKENEGLTNAAQIQYVCRAGNFKKAGYDYKGVMKVLKVILGYEYFWQNVRVEGGAYGCMSSFTREGDMYFVSYRDPHLSRTKDIFESTGEYLKGFNVSERDMTKFVIGTVSNMDTPLTPAQRGIRNLTAYLTDITMDTLQKERDEVIGATEDDIRSLADMVTDTMAQSHMCVIGNENKIKDSKDMFDTVEALL